MSALEDRFIVRIRGFSYDERGEVVSLCWLSENGRPTTVRSDAQTYGSEAEAWDHIGAAGESDASVEAATLSLPGEKAPVIEINGREIISA